VKSEAFKPVVDACTLCDMCFMTKCPYVPPHPFNVDFPHLMLRYRAVEAKKHGVPLADRELTKTDRNGEIAKYAAPLANWAAATDNKLTRGVLEKVGGVHHEAELPRYAGKTFLARARNQAPELNPDAPAYGKRKAVLYATCSMNYNDPELGVLTREVLARLGVATEVVYSSCCGMPQLEQGDIAQVVANARKVAAEMQTWIAQGYDIVAMVPSCALMLKSEWPLLVQQDDPAYGNIKKLSSATYDLTEYIVDIAAKHGLAPGLKPLPGPVALHIACHARAQNIGAKAAEMLKLMPQPAGITVIERCSGHGGSWGVKKDNFEVALKVGKPVARKALEVQQAAQEQQKPSFVASECPLAAVHIAQGVERLDEAGGLPRAWHPVEIFAMGYGIQRADSR
jgi:Fe-S oxidoreductase